MIREDHLEVQSSLDLNTVSSGLFTCFANNFFSVSATLGEVPDTQHNVK